jgi:hypothetical protein
MPKMLISHGKDKINTVKSQIFNIDNGAGTTIDETLLRRPRRVKIYAIRIVYDTETAGTVAAANVKLGTTVGGAEIAAATAYTNSSTVGSVTAVTIVQANIPPNTPIIARHTGIAATAAGQAHVEVDYAED